MDDTTAVADAEIAEETVTEEEANAEQVPAESKEVVNKEADNSAELEQLRKEVETARAESKKLQEIADRYTLKNEKLQIIAKAH